jgi:uncharacterized protein YndB with AHSA1/START domain
VSIHTLASEGVMTVNKSVHVKRSSEDAFRLFVNEIGTWWPLHTNRFTYGGDRAQDIFLEEHVGGRFYERFKDGEEFVIGHVMTCDRPDRIVFTWRAAGEATTEVDVRFSASGDGTQVSLEHRGVEQMARLARAWDAGWDEVLGYYVRAA